MLLHILNRDPGHVSAQQVLRTMGPQDHLVLIEEAVTAVVTTQWEGWRIGPDRISVLREDLMLRGLASEEGPHEALNYRVIDMNGLVDLTVNYPRSVSWH
ncbi:DsrH/TusB family sulfur relay protein [Halomonas sp. LS-001]